jgi:hypothetical protein
LQSISGGLPEITVKELRARDLEDLVIESLVWKSFRTAR